jgi:acyl carrier protein
MYPHLRGIDICTGSTRDGTPAMNREPDTNGHVPWNEIKKGNPYAWDSLDTFTIERNPWDKVVSAFYWHKKIKPYLPGIAENDLSKYVRECDLIPTDWNMYAQGDEVKVDKVFKYEDMDEMYDAMNDRYDIDIPKELWQNTKVKEGKKDVDHWRDLHTPESIVEVEKKFKREIKYMGYTYE